MLTLNCDATKDQLDLIVDLIKETADVPGDILEIGSWKCGTSGFMANCCPMKKVYAFDLFGGLSYGDDKGFQLFGDVDFEEIKTTAAQFPNLHLVRGKHEETIPEFAKTCGPISMMFLDSDFYGSQKTALEYFAPMVSPGGVLLFHDWYFPTTQKAFEEVIIPQSERWQMLDGIDLQFMGAIRRAIH